MHELFCWDTEVGRFHIVAAADGRFHAVFKGFSLGSYDDPHQAAAKLASGDVLPLPTEVNVAKLGIPAELRQWTVCCPGAICPIRRRWARANLGQPGRGPSP